MPHDAQEQRRAKRPAEDGEWELAEDALARERSLLASVMQATDVMLVYLDTDFNFVWVNAAYAATCNFHPDEMVGKNHFALYPHAENEAIFRRVRDTGEPVFYKDKPFEFPDQPERGVTYWDWSLVPVKDPGSKVTGLVFSLRETTKYKRAELALRESEAALLASEQRFRVMADCSPVVMFVTDARGDLRFVNQTYREFFGLSFEEVADMQWQRLLHPEDAPGFLEALWRTTEERRPFRHELRVRRADGEWRWVGVQARPRFSATGVYEGYVGTCPDITERKRAEEALREADRNKNQFLAMLAHELRNPLAPIRNSLYIFDRTAPGSEQARQAQIILDRQVTHLTKLVDELLDVTRISRGKIELMSESLDLRELVARTVDDHRPVFAAYGVDCQVAESLVSEPIWVEGDGTRLIQALGNLLSNAAKFTPRGGQARVALERDTSGDQALIRVQDSGAGLAPEIFPRLFQPFMQVDPKRSGGLGLGLAVVKGLVEMHGGTVTAESPGLGLGATFTIRLPTLSRTQSGSRGP